MSTSNTDELQRFSFDQAPIRGEIVHLQTSLSDALDRHTYPRAVAIELGELMAAAALLSANLKFEGRLTLQVRLPGPVSLLQAETDHQGKLRAIARYDENLIDTDIQFGKGQLVITLEPEQGQKYQGITLIEGGDISAALVNYFEQSEQLSTRIWLTCDGQQSAGFLLQKLPASSADKDEDAWSRITHLASTIKDDELLGLDNEVLLHRLYHEEVVRTYPATPLSFQCTCSRPRLEVALRQLGKEEVTKMIHETPVISINCEFCLQQYDFSQDDLGSIFPHQQLH
ncbi:MAG: Hsp33 family molecular chaperone HslO [Oceanobacter sp.]